MAFEFIRGYPYSHDIFIHVGYSTSYHYAGFASTIEVAQELVGIEFQVDEVRGNIDTHTIYAQIWTDDGSGNLNTKVAEGSISGSTVVEQGTDRALWNTITFGTPFTTVASTKYHFILESSNTDTVNYIRLAVSDATAVVLTPGIYPPSSRHTPDASRTAECITITVERRQF